MNCESQNVALALSIFGVFDHGLSQLRVVLEEDMACLLFIAGVALLWLSPNVVAWWCSLGAFVKCRTPERHDSTSTSKKLRIHHTMHAIRRSCQLALWRPSPLYTLANCSRRAISRSCPCAQGPEPQI